MEVTRQQVIEAARSFTLLGIPWSHQGRDQYGMDCVGLFIAVSEKLQLGVLDFKGYSSRPDGVTFERILEEQLLKLASIDLAQPGDLLSMKYGSAIQHVAILSKIENGVRTVIHSTQGNGPCEHILDERWLLHRRAVIHAAYSIPGVI
jgi:cell wall-associated NlpC family hydrolase